WRESRAVGGDCSRLFGVWLEIDFLFQISSCFFLFVRRSVAVSSPGFRRFAALAQAVLVYGGCLSSVFEPEYPPPSVVCAGGFLYHGGEFVSFSTQAGWCLSSVAGSRRSYGSDGPSVSNFSSSVLGDDERVVVLWSLTATS
ncbi:unnamed protein product, partial [Brassica rapa]